MQFRERSYEDEAKTGFGWSSSAVRRTGLVQLGERPSWIRLGSNSAFCRTELVQLGKRPSWIRGWSQSSSANGRAESVLSPARSFAELDWSGVRLSLKLLFESFYRACVEKVSARKCNFRRWFRDNRFWPQQSSSYKNNWKSLKETSGQEGAPSFFLQICNISLK